MSLKIDEAIHPMVDCRQKRGERTEERFWQEAGAPKRLWDDCLKLESYLRSNTAHSIYKLDGEVSEMIIYGKTSDISQFCEFEWFEWVMF